MFIANFKQTNSSPFVQDKNGQYPFIGEVLAGKSNGAIINGTMFNRGGYEANAMYLCENYVDPEYPDNIATRVISKVGVLEFIQSRVALGAPVLDLKREPVSTEADLEA